MKPKILKYISLSIIGFMLMLNVLAQTTAGDSLFNTPQIHDIYLSFPQPNYWTLLVNNKALDDANDTSTYIPAAVTIDGTQIDSVGIQFKGNSSYYNYPSNKKPFTLSFNEYKPGQKYNGLKNLNLNNLYQDPTFMREKLFLDFCNEKGLFCPRANYARLYINGTFWGLYLMVERVNKTFLKDRFGDNEGNLFKGDNEMAACADLKYHGSMASYYGCYELKTNETLNDWSGLVNLTDKINNTAASAFRDSVEKYMNTNSFIGAWAAYNLFVDFDSYPYRFIHNYYIYHDSITNKFQWIPWDASTAFGMDVPGTVAQIESTSVLYITPQATDRPLVNRMVNDSIYRDTYLNFVCSYVTNDFKPTALDPKIDSLYAAIQADVYNDNLKMYSNQNFDDNVTMTINVSGSDIPGLKSFINNRSSFVSSELATLGYSGCAPIVASVAPVVSSEMLSVLVFPNPANDKVQLEIESETDKVGAISLYNIQGGCVLKYGPINLQKDKTKSSFAWNTASLASGIYVLKIEAAQSTLFKKLIIQR